MQACILGHQEGLYNTVKCQVISITCIAIGIIILLKEWLVDAWHGTKLIGTTYIGS